MVKASCGMSVKVCQPPLALPAMIVVNSFYTIPILELPSKSTIFTLHPLPKVLFTFRTYNVVGGK
jgi:hypothetical protein